MLGVQGNAKVLDKSRYPLHDAVANNDLDRIKDLLDNGYDVNKGTQTETPLICAARKGHLKAAEMLIGAGADVNAVDNYKQSALYYAVTKYNMGMGSNKNKEHAEIAAILIKEGAISPPIRISSDYFVKTLNALSENHKDLATEFLKKEFHREMYYSDPKYISKHINHFLSNKDAKDGLKIALEKLINIDFKYESKLEALTHLSHLHSWTGKVSDYDHQIDAEGWFMNRYPPLKVKSLLRCLKEIHDGNIDTRKSFGESRETAMTKITTEIESQISTYYSQINQDTIKNIMAYKNLYDLKYHDTALNDEVMRISKKISELKPGKEFAIASGFPGHAIYIGFKKSSDGTVARKIYNLGAGINNNHVFSETGRVYPDVINQIPQTKFQRLDSEGSQYIKGVLESKIGMHRDYLNYIYDKGNLLGGTHVLVNFAEPSQKRQLAGNCVLKNNNVATRNRLGNDELFKWLKNQEIKMAEKVCDAEGISLRSKEDEKDKLSLTYIVNEFKRSNNTNGAIVNFNIFFRKRLNLTKANHMSSLDELNDFLKTNKNDKKLQDWINSVDGIKSLIEKTGAGKVLESNKMQRLI